METLLKIFERKTLEALRAAYGDSVQAEDAALAPCAQETFGHYQCNAPLRLAKTFQEPPRAIAQKILDAFDRSLCEKIEIAGPGFLNFTLSASFLSGELQQQLSDPLLGAVRPKKRERVIVEFSSPNVAKELHVGHLRSTIIGDTLARLFEFLGHDVLRLNHIGDWGTQFGMLISYLKEEAPEALQNPADVTLFSLMQWYRAAKKKFDEDPAFKKRSQLEVVELQSGNPETKKSWEAICAISRQGFQEIYDLLGVKLEERGESFYNPYLHAILKELKDKHLLTLSDGAQCVFLDGFKNREGEPLPTIVQKSDGGFNYATTDLATLRHRILEEKADRIILVTDMGQSLHFQMVFAIGEKAGWIQQGKPRIDHVGFGLVLGPDGKKFKTRSGDTEKLIDLLLEAVRRASAILEERLPDMPPSERDHLAQVLGINAIKYADLSCHRTKDYHFSYDRMLRFEGNTAVFLLYSYVRILGIRRKIEAARGTAPEEGIIQLAHPSEIALGLHLRKFGEMLELVAADLLPNRLADYLYHLAEKFNAFFRDCRVEGSPEEASRLALSTLALRILKKGFDILGLETVERM